MNATKYTKQQRINNVLDNWKARYCSSGKWWDKEKETIYYKLITLFSNNPNPSAEEVDTIIGNSSWTTLNCDICGKTKKTLYYFKPRYYDPYENSGLDICKKCLGKKD